MDDKVVRISDQYGPPETQFENEAVEVLLSSIRKFRGDVGFEPEAFVFVLMSDGDALTMRIGHLRDRGPNSRYCQAVAGAALLEASMASDK